MYSGKLVCKTMAWPASKPDEAPSIYRVLLVCTLAKEGFYETMFQNRIFKLANYQRLK